MKKTFIVSVTVFFLSWISCTSIDKEIFIKNKNGLQKKLRIAVMPFKDAPGKDGSGDSVSDSIANEIIKINNWTVVERSQISKVVGEQVLDASGMTAGDYSSLGKLLKTDYIIVGTVSEYHYGRKAYIVPQTRLAYSTRIIETTTGAVAGTARISLETGTYAFCGCLLLSWYYIPLALLSDSNINEDVTEAAGVVVKEIIDQLED